MAVTASEQVARLLALVPYLRAHPDADLDETAALFGVTPRQLISDLKVAWYCGLPGGLPGDMIEINMDLLETEGRISLSNADFLSRPLRFTPDEATSLMVALRLLAEIADPLTKNAVESALSKLEGVVGQIPGVGVQLAAGEESVRGEIARALSTGRAIRLQYHGASRDKVTNPLVDPARVAIRDGNGYLDAWDRRRKTWRTYRLDRILGAQVSRARAGNHGEPPDYSAGWLDGRPDAVEVTMVLRPEARWITEYYPMTGVNESDDGTVTVQLLVADPVWFRRLLLRLGASVLSVEPREAAASAAKAARRALSQSRVG